MVSSLETETVLELQVHVEKKRKQDYEGDGAKQEYVASQIASA